MKFSIFFIFLYLFTFFTFFAFAKKYATEYVSFDMLNNWECYPEGTEHVCTNKLNRKKAAEAMIILTAKQKGPPDTVAQYMNHLKTPRSIQVSKHKTVKSKVLHVKNRQINKHFWVDGFHQGSEVPSYYTRYLVTTKDQLAVLVTYSAHKKHYKKYASDFASSINSLRLKNVSPDFVARRKGSMGMGSVQDYMQGIIDSSGELGDDFGGGEGSDQKGGGGLLDLLSRPEVLGGVAGLGGLSYLLYKRRKRKSTSGKGSSSDRHRSSRRHRSSSSSSRSRRSSSRDTSSRRRR